LVARWLAGSLRAQPPSACPTPLCLRTAGPEALLLYLNRAYTWPVEGIERFGDCGGLLLAAFEGQLEQQHAHSTGWPSVDELFRVGAPEGGT
jgi:hypothetical protein